LRDVMGGVRLSQSTIVFLHLSHRERSARSAG
jgi:hypothetical protein